jgi:Membrane proteins related to metalloendopeptidases
MNFNLKHFLLGVSLIVTMSAMTPAKKTFSAAEQQQIVIPTSGLFDHSNAFSIDFSAIESNNYFFPLPVGKVKVVDDNQALEISTSTGDAVKAMFAGVVRLSRNVNGYGNVVVVRHDNGIETVYANNAQNLVNVGQRVKAGQTVAIVGSDAGRTYCKFSLMINGGRVNPKTFIDLNSHILRKQTILCKKNGNYVDVSVVDNSEKQAKEIKDITLSSNEDKIDLTGLPKSEWSYPLPGSHVISPFGGARHHPGIDLKTRPNDNICATFDGVVTMSGTYFGYGNCIKIKHNNGFETLYGHQSRNLVKSGDKVKAGQIIGLTGRTGHATTEHLHFELFFKGHRLNPSDVFDNANKSLQQITLSCKNGVVKTQRNYFAKK